MAVPETLRHPFATAKIVVWPATCSIRGGLIIAARSRNACGDATLCACGRRGERISDRCERYEAGKCLLHSRALLQMTPSAGFPLDEREVGRRVGYAAAINFQITSSTRPNTRSSSKKAKIAVSSFLSLAALVTLLFIQTQFRSNAENGVAAADAR
jgi:hypothetical protein